MGKPQYATVWEYASMRGYKWGEDQLISLHRMAADQCHRTETETTRRRGEGAKQGQMVPGYPVPLLDTLAPKVI